MDLGFVASTAGSVVWAAVLVNAAAAKLASPTGLKAAVAELRVPRLPPVGTSAVRVIASIELLIATALSMRPSSVGTTVAATTLGATFAAVGAVGWYRRSSLPCGCVGAQGRPLGPINIGAGGALIAAALVNRAFVDGWSARTAAASLLWSAIVAIMLAMWMQRASIGALARRSRPAGGRA